MDVTRISKRVKTLFLPFKRLAEYFYLLISLVYGKFEKKFEYIFGRNILIY